jgi:hypothetical protein
LKFPPSSEQRAAEVDYLDPLPELDRIDGEAVRQTVCGRRVADMANMDLFIPFLTDGQQIGVSEPLTRPRGQG